jgi:hypothetical protein
MAPYSDHPTLVDMLDRAKLVQEFATQIVSCSPPAAFGVHRDWGSGKTSVLRLLRHYLSGLPDKH